MSSASYAATLPNLPDDVWGKVFTYLLLEDRKNIRLTCYHFYELSRSVNLLKPEKMVFYGNYGMDMSIDFFSSCTCVNKMWNLELHMMHLQGDSVLSFFHSQGDMVHSLILYDCELAPGMLKHIIMLCINMCHFTVILRSTSL